MGKKRIKDRLIVRVSRDKTETSGFVFFTIMRKKRVVIRISYMIGGETCFMSDRGWCGAETYSGTPDKWYGKDECVKIVQKYLPYV